MLISRLCATEGVADDEAAGMSMALLFAGHETTVVQIGMTALLLLAEPDQWQGLSSTSRAWSIARSKHCALRARAGTGFPVMRVPT